MMTESQRSTTLDSLGYIHHRLGDYRGAIDRYQWAIEISRDNGDRYHEASQLVHLGESHHAVANPDSARQAWQEALHIFTELNHCRVIQVSTKLRTLPRGQP